MLFPKMNFLVIFVGLTLSSTLFLGCNQKETSECNCELLTSELQEKNLFIENLTADLGGINDMMDSIFVAQEVADTEPEADAINTIESLERYVREANEKITSLEERLHNNKLNANQISILNRTIDNFKRQLESKEEEIEQLKITLIERDQEIVSVKEKLSTSLQNSKAKDTTITDLQAREQTLKTDLENLEDSLANAQEGINSALLQAQARKNFELGKVYFDELDLIKSKLLVGAKKAHRKDIAEKAYKLLVAANNGGVKEAKPFIDKLLFDKTYNRHLGIRPPTKN